MTPGAVRVTIWHTPHAGQTTMLRQFRSDTRDVALDRLLETLCEKDEVDAVMLFGSAQGPVLRPYGDIDLVVVLDEDIRPRLSMCFCYIENRIGDVYFFTTDQIDELAGSGVILDAGSIEGKLVCWLADGRIVCDKSGRLDRLREGQIETEVPDSRKHAVWFRINYDYFQSLRMFNSGDEAYLEALEIRLPRAVCELMPEYMELRDVPYPGDKGAVAYFKAHDPGFLGKFRQCFRTGSLEFKFRLYSELVTETLEGAGEMWDERAVELQFAGDYTPQAREAAVALWNRLTMP